MAYEDIDRDIARLDEDVAFNNQRLPRLITEDFTDRGIEGGVVDREVSERLRLANTPLIRRKEDLLSLKARLAEEEALANSEREKILASARKTLASGRTDEVGKFDKSRPSVLIKNLTGPDGTKSFSLQIPGAPNALEFENYHEALAELDRRGLRDKVNILIGGLGETNADLLNQFSRSGATIVNPDTGRKAIGKSGELTANKFASGFASQASVIGSGARRQVSDEQTELEKLGTPSASSIDFSKISKNAQARLYDQFNSEMTILAQKTAIPAQGKDISYYSPAQQIALLAGVATPSERYLLFQEAARNGQVRRGR